MTDTEDHYNMQPRRKAEFYNPPNHLKLKVGNGGLTENILNKAQALLENNSVDFTPLAEMYLDAMMKGIEQARTPSPDLNKDTMIAAILFPGMQLKANGGMFQYQLVTQIADRFIQFIEVIDTIDPDALEIIIAFHTTIRAVILGRIKGDGGKRGEELITALIEACHRYFEKKQQTR
ncbi:MAG: hypothetical protein JNL76_03455 [Alphaproteobacteria bacterium]|nr:hypothetical protein [Alphaproteobacteria bacterium]